MIIRFQLLDADYFLNGNKPVIRLFGRDAAGRAVCVLYDKMQPYFYVKCSNPQNLNGINAIGVEEVKRFLAVGYQKGPTALVKITLTNPQDVPKLKDQLLNNKLIEDAYEADILFKYRFMVDKNIYGMQWLEVEGERVNTIVSKTLSFRAESIKPLELEENADLKYMAFDIECVPSDPRKPLNDKKDGIVMISLAFSHEYRGRKSLVLVAKRTSGENVQGFSTEKEMLEEFLKVINDYDPDVLTGYNINMFDFPYIIERLKQNKLPQNLGRTDKITFLRTLGMTQEYVLTGRVVVDPYQILKRDPWVKFPRYDLNTVSKLLLNDQKHDIEYGEMSGLWNGTREDLSRFIEYARKDAELSLKLVLGRGMLDKFVELSKVSGLLLQDVMGGQTRRIETMVLHEFRKRGFVMPLAPSKAELVRRTKERDKQSLKGAIVLEPKKGLQAEGCVLVLDFKSLYPSIMRTYNVSPDTLTSAEENSHQSPSGAYFIDQSVHEGIFPNILARVLAARGNAKKLMKTKRGEEKRILDAKQKALKDISNSFYGYTGYTRARLYTIDVANTITAYGRKNIEKTRKLVEENFDVEVVYGDSITKDRFVTLLNPHGMVEVKNIKELFEQHKEHAVVTQDGKERIPLAGYKALTVSLGKTTEWSLINEIIRHKTNKKIYRVGQKFGETVVTEDHSLMTDNNGLLEETKPGQIADRKIARIEKIPHVQQVQRIDMYELLNGYTHKHEYKGRIKTATFHADDNFVWFGWTVRKNPIRVMRFINVGSDEFDALCKLIGAYAAEGSSSTLETTTRYGASIASSDNEWLKELQAAYALLFEGAESCIIRSTTGIRELAYGDKKILYEDKTCKLQMMNSLSAVIFKVLCGQKSSGKKLPSFVFHIPEANQNLILHHMLKGDGYIEKSIRYTDAYKAVNFRYDTKSLNLISCLSLLLTMQGRKYTIRFRKNKNVYRITTCSKYNSSLRTNVCEEAYDGYVYDLAVDKNHMFVDACGQILLHNTDSIFVKTKTTNLDEAKEMGEKISKFVTEKLPGHLELDFEKIYRTFLILTKKRYAGWRFDKTDEGWHDSIEMRGIETVRRDWCLTGDTLVQMSDGTLSQISDIPNKCSVMTINPNTLKLQKDISIAKSARKSKILRLTTDFTEVKATPEHKFFAFSDGHFQFKRTTDLKKGDYVIQAKTINIEGKPQKIDFEYELKSSGKSINIQHITTEELCQILGFVFGDGSIVNRKVTVYNKNLSILEHYNKLFIETFGVGGKLYAGKGCYNMVFFSKKLEMFFRHLDIDKRDKIPDFLHRLPKNQLAAFLRGYFDADGGLSINNNTASRGRQYLDITFAANSKRVAEEVKLLLLRFGIWSSNLRFHKSLGTAYEFSLKCENARLFLENIGFTNKKIEFERPKTLKGKTERLPMQGNARLLMKKAGYSPTKFLRGPESATMTRSTACSIVNFVSECCTNLDEEGLDNLDMINKVLQSDISFTKVEKVEDAGEAMVYDIDTINTDTFLANGLLSHNCPLVSELMEKVLHTILKEGDLAKAIELVKGTINDLRAGKIQLEKLTIIKGITKNVDSYEGMLPHIELARKLTKRNPQDPPKIGDRLGFVIIKGDQMLSKRAEDPKYVEQNKIQLDSDYYIQSQLFPPIERILTAVGIQRSEVLGSGRQMSLGDVMTGRKRELKHNIEVNYEKPLEGWEEFVCKKCSKSYRRMPLNGLCECGGEMLIGYHGSTSDKVSVK